MNIKPKITVTYMGKSFSITPSKCLLDDLRACNIPVGSGCRQGICGMCTVSVKSGEVIHHRLPLSYLKSHERLACIAEAISDIEIDEL